MKTEGEEENPRLKTKAEATELDLGVCRNMVDLSCICNSQTVQRSHSHVNDLLPSQTLHHLRLPHVNICPMTQTEVIALPPAHISNERTTLTPTWWVYGVSTH